MPLAFGGVHQSLHSLFIRNLRLATIVGGGTRIRQLVTDRGLIEKERVGREQECLCWAVALNYCMVPVLL